MTESVNTDDPRIDELNNMIDSLVSANHFLEQKLLTWEKSAGKPIETGGFVKGFLSGAFAVATIAIWFILA